MQFNTLKLLEWKAVAHRKVFSLDLKVVRVGEDTFLGVCTRYVVHNNWKCWTIHATLQTEMQHVQLYIMAHLHHSATVAVHIIKCNQNKTRFTRQTFTVYSMCNCPTETITKSNMHVWCFCVSSMTADSLMSGWKLNLPVRSQPKENHCLSLPQTSH